MLVTDLVLPILIGIIASILLLSILYNNKNDIKQKFLDIGKELLYEQHFNTTNSHIWMPLKNECTINNNQQSKITTNSSIKNENHINKPIYHNYPQIPIE